jgi:RimJ/RimL family protein N-acetyltransferase
MQILPKTKYHLVTELLKELNINTLFARAVAEHYVTGIIYTDNTDCPASFYVVHPYGLSLLFGEPAHGRFFDTLKDYLLNIRGTRDKVEWLQVFPAEWNRKIEELAGNLLVKSMDVTGKQKQIIEEHKRVNFAFDSALYYSAKIKETGYSYIQRTTREHFEQMTGTVVPARFWDNADDFCAKGIGFSLIVNNLPVCTAYSAYIFDGLLEIGIETNPDYRGKGYALQTCSALIDYCIANNYKPIWSCRLENTGSYNLAKKLGFRPTLTLPFYRLPE